jgi:putative nucleotidyltransferase with HDIG domain
MNERTPLTLARVLLTVESLPALPEAVREVLLVLERDGLSAERCVRLIEQDQALAARTLRVANSAFYGMSERVARIGDAVAILGLRAMSGVLAAVAMSSQLAPQRCEGFSFSGYWRHALGVALCARSLAGIWGADPEQAFLAGLMHDSGKLVLAAHFPAEGAAALALAASADLSSTEAERMTFQLDHGQIGAALAAHWRFPPAIVQAIAHHHGVAAAPAGVAHDLTALVHLSDALTHALGLAAHTQEAVPEMDTQLWMRLALTETAALDLLARVERSVQELCSALAL